MNKILAKQIIYLLFYKTRILKHKKVRNAALYQTTPENSPSVHYSLNGDTSYA